MAKLLTEMVQRRRLFSRVWQVIFPPYEYISLALLNLNTYRLRFRGSGERGSKEDLLIGRLTNSPDWQAAESSPFNLTLPLPWLWQTLCSLKLSDIT